MAYVQLSSVVRGPMLSMLHDGGAHVVVMLTKELVVYMTPDSRGCG